MRARSRVVTLALVVAGALGFVGLRAGEGAGAHAIVDADNQRQAVPAPEPGELRVPVGPPAATLSLRVVEPAGAPRGVIFLLHGIHSRKEGLHGWAERLAAAGYRAVMVDSRGHGRSTGQWLSYGVQEASDLSQLLTALAIPPSLPVGVMGVSYGAATAIEWAGREPRVRAAVALAPFSSLRDVVPVYVPRMVPLVGRYLPSFMLKATVDEAGRMAGFDPDAASPLDAAARRDVPILIFHGDADRHIPLAQSQAIAAHARHVELRVLPGQDHNHIAGDARLWPAVTDFFAGTLTNAPSP